MIPLLMARNFTTTFRYQAQLLQATLLPLSKPDGLHYEINIHQFPRFTMAWSPLGRYDIVSDTEVAASVIPYEIVLALSEILERVHAKK